VEAGEAAGGAVWPAAGAGRGAALEVGDGADGWAPSVGERERGRERRGRGGPAGLIGPGELGGPRGKRQGKEEGGLGRAEMS
jgi:hypothetical protein